METNSEMIRIRKGTRGDVEAIMDCYDKARQFMRSCGNMKQWINGYPSRELIEKDITDGVNYVGEDSHGALVMTFAFIIGEDPTYSVIEGGRWLSNKPYGTIHRLGSTGKYSGILRHCVEFCLTIIDNIRLDTHADNLPMQRAATQLLFTPCGTIYCADGSPRIAYQYTKS